MSKNLQYGLTTETIEKLQTVFKSYPTVERVILYGSRALGTYKASSDIDLTIFTLETNLSFLHKIENDIDDLLLPYKVDLSLYSGLDNKNLQDHIQRVGIAFYLSNK